MIDGTAPKPFVFVLMPFSDEFHDIYELGIKAACQAAGAHCERVDEQVFDGTILERIYNQIAKADIIVSEMTGRNPNVFYETGYAHALNKRTIMLTKSVEDIPFDLKHYSHIVHEDKIANLKRILEDRIRWCIAHPLRSVESADRQTDVYVAEHRHPGQGETLRVERQLENYFKNTIDVTVDIDIHNTSLHSLSASTFSAAVALPRGKGTVTGRSNTIGRDESPFTTISALSAKNTLWNLRLFHNVLPDAWHAWSLLFELPHNTVDDGILTLDVRLYSELGSKSYPVVFDLSNDIKQRRLKFEEEQKDKEERHRAQEREERAFRSLEDANSKTDEPKPSSPF